MQDNIWENKRFLVAEDEAMNQMVVKDLLLKSGAEADIAGDGTEAIEKLKNGTYDIVLMDIEMPLMDGYETTIYIRKQLKSNVPVIGMTALAKKSEERKCTKCGMNGYIAKPFDIESLSNVIQKLVALSLTENSNSYILSSNNVAVDISMLYEISGNNESFIHTMIQTFLNNMPNTLDNIEQSLHEQDWDKVYKSAHFAKSSLSVIKISEVFDWVLTIERNARQRVNLEGLPAIFDKVKLNYKIAEQVLREKFAIGSPS